MDDTERERELQRLREWLTPANIRRALFWARVRTVMLLIVAAASVIVAIEAILSWLP